jgi:hypothetical protein
MSDVDDMLEEDDYDPNELVRRKLNFLFQV